MHLVLVFSYFSVFLYATVVNSSLSYTSLYSLLIIVYVSSQLIVSCSGLFDAAYIDCTLLISKQQQVTMYYYILSQLFTVCLSLVNNICQNLLHVVNTVIVHVRNQLTLGFWVYLHTFYTACSIGQYCSKSISLWSPLYCLY